MLFFAIFLLYSSKVDELVDDGTKEWEKKETTSIADAVMRMEALNESVKMLTKKLVNEIQSTQSFLSFFY